MSGHLASTAASLNDGQSGATARVAAPDPVELVHVPDEGLLLEPAADRGAVAIWQASPATTSAEYAGTSQVNTEYAGASQVKTIVTLPVRGERASRRASVQVRHRWTGVVIEVGRDTFTAELAPSGGGAREVAELELDALSEDDRPLVATGAVFYWSVGYETTHGTRRAFSEIRFRRLPAWTRGDLSKLDEPSDLDDLFR